MKIDGRQSNEDKIIPVEKTYADLSGRIAVLGGLDIDFLARSDESAVYRRSKAMLDASALKGGYALGSGNSVPDYIPLRNYLAMLRAALEY
jgi:uroporphyrinogen decarboxylase